MKGVCGRRIGQVARLDAVTNMADYLQYVRDPANGYLTVNFPVADGMELQLLDRPLTPGEPGTGGQFLQPRPQ